MKLGFKEGVTDYHGGRNRLDKTRAFFPHVCLPTTNSVVLYTEVIRKIKNSPKELIQHLHYTVDESWILYLPVEFGKRSSKRQKTSLLCYGTLPFVPRTYAPNVGISKDSMAMPAIFRGNPTLIMSVISMWPVVKPTMLDGVPVGSKKAN